MPWEAIVVLSVVGELLGTLVTFLYSSYRLGSVPRTRLVNGDWERTKKEKQQAEFWKASKECAPVWPLGLVFLLLKAIFADGLWNGLHRLSDSLEEQSRRNAERLQIASRETRYNELWNKRNQLSWGESLKKEEWLELRALEKIVTIRPDERVKPDVVHFAFRHSELVDRTYDDGYQLTSQVKCTCGNAKYAWESSYGDALFTHLSKAIGRGETVEVSERVEKFLGSYWIRLKAGLMEQEINRKAEEQLKSVR